MSKRIFKRDYYNYNRYNYYNSFKRKHRGKNKAAKEANTNLNFVVKCNHAFSAQYDPNGEIGTAALNIWEILKNNATFDKFSELYDSVKINGVGVKLSVTDATTTVSNINQIKSINVITAWDRTGLSDEQVLYYDVEKQVIDKEDYDNYPMKYWRTKIGKAIVNNGSAKKSILNSFQRWSHYESLWASNLEEKSEYISTSVIEPFSSGFDPSTNVNQVSGDFSNMNVNSITSLSNPAVPFETSSVKWKPILLVGVFTTGFVAQTVTNDNDPEPNPYYDISQYAKTLPVLFNAELSINCTFRSLKGSQ